MKLLCFKSSLFFIFSFLYGEKIGFFYGNKVPKEFERYDFVVVQNNIKPVKKNYIAYISIAEQLNPKKSWIIGKNKNWGSFIVDIRNIDYQNYLLEKLKGLKDFRGFFFDTLDSYELVLREREWKSYEEAEIEFIKKVKKLYPNKIIILNRGFNIVPFIKDDIYAVVAEGMFYGFNGKKFVKISKRDREWLINKLKSLKVRVVVIDYFNGKDIKKAKILAKKIKSLGFIPFVTTPHLNSVGISY